MGGVERQVTYVIAGGENDGALSTCGAGLLVCVTTEVENANMETAVKSTYANGSCDVPLAGLASAVAIVAAGSLLGYSLFSKKRRVPMSAQIGLGVLAGCAGVVIWKDRQGEALAARQFIGHINDKRDAHWLKRHPITYA